MKLLSKILILFILISLALPTIQMVMQDDENVILKEIVEKEKEKESSEDNKEEKSKDDLFENKIFTTLTDYKFYTNKNNNNFYYLLNDYNIIINTFNNPPELI